MRNGMLIQGLGLLLGLAFVSPALGDTLYTNSAQKCRPTDSADTYTMVYRGITNGPLNWYETEFYCPITGVESTTVDPTSGTIVYYDANDYASPNVSCYWVVTTETGTSYTSSRRYSCAADTTNGCTSSPSDHFAGYGKLTWPSTFLNGGASVSGVAQYAAVCSLPWGRSIDYSAGDSYILSYRVTQAAR